MDAGGKIFEGLVEARKHSHGENTQAREHTIHVLPDGWVLVPREPTQAMKEAGYRAMMHTDFTGPQETNCYKAMLSAAPSAPEKE